MSILKRKYFEPNKDVVCPIEEEGGRVLPDQWSKLVAYWNRDEVKVCVFIFINLHFYIYFLHVNFELTLIINVKVRSNKNKAARSKRTMDHLTGKTPFAQVYDKLVYFSYMFSYTCIVLLFF